MRAFLSGAAMCPLLLALFVVFGSSSDESVPRGADSAASSPVSSAHAAVIRLRGRNLLVPVAGVRRAELRDSFADARGARRHEAIDIVARRGTPVRAVDDGIVERLGAGGRGGLTLRQIDPTASYRYLYAHLDAYAPGLRDGDAVRRGELIGFVGSTGNARREAPHLHFAIFEVRPEARRSLGLAVDPYLVFRPRPSFGG